MLKVVSKSLNCIVHGTLLIHRFRSGSGVPVIRKGNPLVGLQRPSMRLEDTFVVHEPTIESGVAQSKDRTIIIDIRKGKL